MHDPDVHFKRMTAATVLDVCKLSYALSDEQRKMVADNAVSLAQAAYSDGAWVRAIYADSDLVGFIMLHLGSDYDDGIDCPGVFLWRLMIAAMHYPLPWRLLGVQARIAYALTGAADCAASCSFLRRFFVEPSRIRHG